MNASRICFRLMQPSCKFYRCRSLPKERLLACMRWRQSSVASHSYSTMSTEVIAAAVAEGQHKVYPEKIQNLVDEISRLTLIEVSDLNDLLKKTLKISDTPMMAMGSAVMPQAIQEEEEIEEPQRKSLFTVKLTGFDAAKKVTLIKEIKKLMTDMNLVQAKKFVESTPQTVKGELTKEEAEELKKVLEAAGGQATAA